ncbi:MAG TPA: histidine kinase, partial [Syntrophobacteraceae bacterium]|nr:histidine kinase [Syntrophobacteraceae bacterium]
MKLRVKALLLFTSVGVFVVVTVGIFQYFNLREEKLQTIKVEVSRQIEHVDHALRWFLEEGERDLLGLAADQRVRSRNDQDFTNFLNADEHSFEYHIGALESEIIEILNAFRTTHPHVNSVYMGRENGSFVRSHKRPRPTRYDPRTRPWYVLAKDNPGEVMRTKPYRSVTSSDVNIG